MAGFTGIGRGRTTSHTPELAAIEYKTKKLSLSIKRTRGPSNPSLPYMYVYTYMYSCVHVHVHVPCIHVQHVMFEFEFIIKLKRCVFSELPSCI